MTFDEVDIMIYQFNSGDLIFTRPTTDVIAKYLWLINNDVTFLNQFSRCATNITNITAKSSRKELKHLLETVMSSVGYSYVTKDTVRSPSSVFVLHTY